MPYVGNQPTSVAFLTDTFNGNGSTTAFTLSAAPATSSSILVAVSGVLQDPSTYSVNATTLTFSAAPPSGTGNISVRFLGIPASGVVTTAYRTQTEFTATAGQTTFSVPSYTVGYIDVYRNGVLLGSADFTATNGTTVVLAAGASAGDLIETVSFYVSSVVNAIPAVAGAVNSTYLLDGSVTKAKMAASGAWAPVGTVIQVVQASSSATLSTTSTSFIASTLIASITPTSATSKILVTLNSGITTYATGDIMYTQFYRQIASGSYSAIGGVEGMNLFGTSYLYPHSLSWLDSPATTSVVNYQPYYKSNGGSTVYFNYNFAPNSGIVTLTLMEIAA